MTDHAGPDHLELWDLLLTKDSFDELSAWRKENEEETGKILLNIQ